MRDLLKNAALLLALALMTAACSSGGSKDVDQSDKSDKKADADGDSDDAKVEAARAAWPAYTGDLEDRVDLSAYNVVTLIPFTNLTDNSTEADAGEEIVDEIEDQLTDRYEDVFEQVRVADAPLGRADEVVVRGQVYDYSRPHFNYWTGRTKAKFKAEMSLENGASGELLKSSRIKEDGRYEDVESLLDEAARNTAKMLARSKSKGAE